MRPRLEFFRLGFMILPSDKLAHHKRRINTLVILELCMIKRASSQQHISINSFAPASQIASFPQLLQHSYHINKRLEFQGLLFLQNCYQLIFWVSKVSSCLAQSWKTQHLWTHTSISFVLGEKIGPVELFERAFGKLRSDQSSIRFETLQILPKQLLLIIGMVRLQGWNQQVKTILLRNPAIRSPHISQLFDWSWRIDEWLGCRISEVVN